ncbi:hypothetical protein KW786_01255, partial [Candidatus Parcubacteria bacterium]|nr:hypothetical protein [Candidatus Parcubacteria bacterium]
DLPKDDPLIIIEGNKGNLYLPDKPMTEQKPFASIEDFPLHDSLEKLQEIKDIAEKVFIILEDAWKKLGIRLMDAKVEFGINTQGNIKLSDVIDNDSWRLLDKDGKNIDKQIYRDGGDLETVKRKYQEVAELTERF